MNHSEINMVPLSHREEMNSGAEAFGMETAEMVNRYHRSFPEYEPTPLVSFGDLAKLLHVKDILVKDESFRFGLNAFKVLGSSYAIARVAAEKLGLSEENMDFGTLTGKACRDYLKGETFITATDGNHGRGVAWTANRLGAQSVVYMPRGTVPERLHNIQALGSRASITDLKYDDAVRKAARDAQQNGWTLVQDTSWEGYEKIPRWIMQGYTTMAYEAVNQMRRTKKEKPTHIFLQAGVGSMCAAVAAFYADLYKENRPRIIVVEPDRADCLYRTALADDGKLHSCQGEMNTIMAGLACGEPCTIAWDILQNVGDYFVSVPDRVAAKGMRMLGNPPGNDRKIVSGESGASAFGLAAVLLSEERYADLKEKMGLDEDSRILCFSTEGATDRENYRRIVWDGAVSQKG